MNVIPSHLCKWCKTTANTPIAQPPRQSRTSFPGQLVVRWRTPAIDHRCGKVGRSELIDLAYNKAQAQLGFYAHLLKPLCRQGGKKITGQESPRGTDATGNTIPTEWCCVHPWPCWSISRLAVSWLKHHYFFTFFLQLLLTAKKNNLPQLGNSALYWYQC